MPPPALPTLSKPSPAMAEKLRDLVKCFIVNQDYESAAFWAEKVLYITNDANDAYERARCLYNLKEYHRAAHTIKSRNLHMTSLPCLYLAAKCHYAEKDYREAFQILELPIVLASEGNVNETTFIGRHSNRHHQQHNKQEPLYNQNKSRWLGSISLLKGKIFECLDNRQMAEKCFREALHHDIFCFEAYTCLTCHHMLTSEEEILLFNSFNIDKNFQSEPEMGDFVKLFYQLQFKKYDKPYQISIPTNLEYLSNNVDVMTALAERHYYNCDYQSAFELTTTVLERDVYHTQCLPIHISCLMELNKPNQLFDIAHKLVDLYPENAISWFAVGCYYLIINKVEQARRYLSKATTLDNVFGPAWLVFGHSFAVEKEHDQAMAAYFKAFHLMKGCHLPLLYIGVEYGRSDNCKLAEKFLTQAKNVAPQDPFVLHEFGVIHYRNKNFSLALECFLDAYKGLSVLKTASSKAWFGGDKFQEKWEPLLNNIGHSLRRLKRYDEAIEYHKKALTLIPHNASTYSTLGFLYCLKTDWDKAIDYLHKASSLKHNDSISTSIMDIAVKASVQNDSRGS